MWKKLDGKSNKRSLKLPLLRLDMGKIFSGIVGSTEENMRKAIQTAEASHHLSYGLMKLKRDLVV